MGRQYFRTVVAGSNSAAFPTITATSETVLVPTLFTPIGPSVVGADQVWKLTVGGTCTTGTAGTLIITPRYGLVIGGVALGASPTQNYVPSITLAPFIFEYWLAFRSVQIAAGATSTVTGFGKWSSNGAVATAASETAVVCGSTGSVSVDASVASGLWIGVTFSVAPSVIPHFCVWECLN